MVNKEAYDSNTLYVTVDDNQLDYYWYEVEKFNRNLYKSTKQQLRKIEIFANHLYVKNYYEITKSVIAFDYVPDNQDIRNKYRQLKQLVEKSEAKVIILDMICFEYFILAFDKLVSWTGTGKTDKIKMREDILAAIEDHRIDLSKIDNQMTMHYLSGFKRYSTERVMKSLVGEFTQNEKWSVKGPLMGECWYKDCCVSEHPDSLRCGKPEVDDGNEKMRMLIQSEEIQKVIMINNSN